MDSVDIRTVGLLTLRRAMGVIPQEPLLLTGTVRDNLDPFDVHADAKSSIALEQVGIGDLQLDAAVGTGASGLSSGQRQLVSLARTLLCDARVVVMDEPTSNVDSATDEAVQKAVRRCFAGRTVLTIAHRLNTVIDCDLIVVMDSGRVVESGAPSVLLDDPQSRFAMMARDLGAGAAQALIRRSQRGGSGD